MQKALGITFYVFFLCVFVGLMLTLVGVIAGGGNTAIALA